MKRIAIVLADASLGGTETALINMLKIIDYIKFDVTLYTNFEGNVCVERVPKSVKLVDLNRYTTQELAKQYVKRGRIHSFCKLLRAYHTARKIQSETKRVEKLRNNFLISSDEYDCVIAYGHLVNSISIALFQLNAKRKIAWIHGQLYGYPKPDPTYTEWIKKFDYIFGVSKSVVEVTVKAIPEIVGKISVFENIIDTEDINTKARIAAQSAMVEMKREGDQLIILSIGRFSNVKNFSNIPYICRQLLNSGHDIRWYLIGYGEEEQLIKDRIAEWNAEDRVIILGKKENPYPYIANCDVYIQPSLHEGKCVCVLEAQVLHKPVIITNYRTAEAQLRNGIDGIIVPQQLNDMIREIGEILGDKALLQQIADNTYAFDYSNRNEIVKFYKAVEEGML